MPGQYKLGTWAILLAVGLQRCSAICDVASSVELVEKRGYDLTGQTHVVTGGDSGIGYGIALALAQANARIIFLGHDLEKTTLAMRKITELTKNDKVSAVPIDLMSFASVKSAVSMILQATNRVDAVVCDAGLAQPIQPAVTADGFESVIQVSYISHFYLVELLLPELRKTKGRVVHTSTLGIDSFELCIRSGFPQGCNTIDSLSKIVRTPNQDVTPPAIGSVFMGLYMKTLHAKILAIRESNTGVSAYSFHPGLVATGTGFQAVVDAYGGAAAIEAMCSFKSSSAKVVDAEFRIPGLVEACEQNPAWQNMSDQCKEAQWYQCMCNLPDGFQNTCPLRPEAGAVTGAFLAAAPKIEVSNLNGALTVACDYVPILYGDPITEMVNTIGERATISFLSRFYDLSLSWIPTTADSTYSTVDGERILFF